MGERGERGQRGEGGEDARGGDAEARVRPRTWHRLAGWAADAGLRALAALPTRLAYALADALSLGLVAATLVHQRRVRRKGRGVDRNLAIAFRDRLDGPSRRRLLFGWARHMCRLVVDFASLPGIRADNLAARVDASALEGLRPLVAEGRGLICASGHIGFFELAGHVASLLGFPVTFVARPAALAPIDDLLLRIRTSGGQEVVSKWGVLWPLKKALDRGRVVGIAADENVRDKPVFVPFLGALAASSPTAALLQRATGAPIAVITCERVGPGRFRLRVWDVIQHDPGAASADKDGHVQAVTARIAAALSRAILARPEQWFWGSRRFLTRPPGEEPGPDGLPPPAPGWSAPQPVLTGADEVEPLPTLDPERLAGEARERGARAREGVALGERASRGDGAAAGERAAAHTPAGAERGGPGA